jgi:hypothetical protein
LASRLFKICFSQGKTGRISGMSAVVPGVEKNEALGNFRPLCRQDSCPFPMLADVQPDILFILGDTQPHGPVDRHGDEIRDNEGLTKGSKRTDGICKELGRVAFHQSGKSPDCRCGKNAGRERPP